MKLIVNYAFAILSIVLIALGSITFAGEQKEIKQETHGDQSPAISGADSVTIIYRGISKKEREILFKDKATSQRIIVRLLKELENKDIELENKEATIQVWAKKYEDLSKKISQLPEDSDKSAKAKAALVEGDLNKAESFVTMSGVSFHGVSINR